MNSATGWAAALVAWWTLLPADARAGGLTFLADDPAGVFASAGPSGGVGGAATIVDGQFGFDDALKSVAAWDVSPSALELAVDQRTGTEGPLPVCLANGTFVFTVDSPQTYTLSGHYAYGPAVEGTGAFGLGDAIVDLQDATTGEYLFRNSLTGPASTSTTFVLGEHTGDPNDALEGSLVGTLVPGRVYHLFFWVQTVNFQGGPAVAGEAVVRLDVAALDTDGDGLSDALEDELGSDPEVADTDGDGLEDGEEHALGGGDCPDLLVADSDGDTLLDGAEVGSGTDACASDTDGDGAPDALDPSPTVPGATTEQLVELAGSIAAGLAELPLSEFVAPTARSAAQRRASLVARVEDAAAAIAAGDELAASELLLSVRVRIDGDPTPTDWLAPSAEQAALLARVDALLALLD